jgi:MFS family permease
VICTAGLALPLLTLGVLPVVWLLLISAFVAGLAIEQFAVAWETTMQEHVPGDRLARVYSYDMVGSFLAMPLGEVVAGPVAHAVGTRTALIGAAALIVAAVLGILASPDVRRLAHRPAVSPDTVADRTESVAYKP